MSVDPSALVPGSVWVHRKGGIYVVLGISTCSTNGEDEGKEVVVYWSCTYQGLRHRAIAEFLDGRFQPTVFALPNKLGEDIDTKDLALPGKEDTPKRS
jgi:hypothetical protein